MILTVGMATRSITRNVGPLSFRAMFAPATLDPNKRTVQVTWTTGARVQRGGFFSEPFLEELSLDKNHVRMGRLQSGRAPLLDSHNAERIVDSLGVVQDAQIDSGGRAGSATVRFDSGPGGSDAMRRVGEGTLSDISVGYRVHKMKKMDDDEASKMPVYRAVDWEPHELSLTPMGADADSYARAAANTTTNVCEFTEERTMDPENPITPAPVAAPSAAAAATSAARAARIEDAAALAAARQAAAEEARDAERTRSSAIRGLARRHRMGETWAQTVIDAGSSVAEAQAAVLADLGERDREGPTGVGDGRIDAGEDARDKFVRGASAWLFQSTGTRKLMEAAKAKKPDLFADVTFDPGEFRGMSPVDLARESLERNRVNTRGMDKLRMVGLAFTHRAGQFQVSGDFPILLENVLGKVLLGAYAVQNNTWERFCKTEEVPDFRTSNRYRTGSLPGLDVIAEHQEYKTGAVPDGAKYPLTTQRMGKMFGISQETIINDDMGALTDQASKLGQAAMRSLENAVYALLTANAGLGPTQADAQPFFHANRANVNATGSALTVTGIDADRVVFRAQKDPNGLDFLDLQPAVLLVPDSLNGQAKEINDAAYEFGASAAATSPNLRPNRVRGLFRDVVSSPRLTGTRRYLIADTMEAIVVAFLAGYGHGPVLDSQAGWRVDGVEWKVTLFAKAQMGDPKAAVTNAGV